jgi:C-terminal processing protease CtpA/Prc
MQNTIRAINNLADTIRRVEVYTLAEALVEAQKGALDGYIIDLVTNEGYPSQYISSFSFNMVKKECIVVDDSTDVESAVKTKVAKVK